MPTRTLSADVPPADLPPADVVSRLDRLSAQVEEMAVELRAQRVARQRWSDLVNELTPVAQGVMTVLERELEDLSVDVTADDAARFARTVTRSLPRLETVVAQLDSLAELMSDVTSLAGASIGRLSDALAVAQQRGYLDLAQAAAGVADKAVAAVDAQELRALGEQVGPIFQTVKELTQPELLALVRRAAAGLRDGDGARAGAGPTPSTLALLRQLRDPQVRRGLARTLAVLGALGAEPHAGTPTPAHVPTSQEGTP